MGEWNRLNSKGIRDRVTVLLNDQVVNQGSNLAVKKGPIMLRFGDLEIAIRKMELQPL